RTAAHYPHLHRVSPFSQHSCDTEPIAPIVTRATNYTYLFVGVESLSEPRYKLPAGPFHEVNGSNGFVSDGVGIPRFNLIRGEYLQHTISLFGRRANSRKGGDHAVDRGWPNTVRGVWPSCNGSLPRGPVFPA